MIIITQQTFVLSNVKRAIHPTSVPFLKKISVCTVFCTKKDFVV